MATSRQLEAIGTLQQIIAQTQEVGDLLKKLLPEILGQLAGIGFHYQLVSALFLDDAKAAKKSSLAYRLISDTVQPLDVRILNVPAIVAKANTGGGLTITDNIQGLIHSAYPDLPAITCVVVSLIHPTKGLTDVLFLATSRQRQEITDEEKQIVQLIVNQIALVHRLQETHDSLTTISQEVYKMNFQLHELDKMKTEFVSLASHELLTPISAIEGYLSMMLDEKIVDPKSDKGVEYLKRIYGASKRLAKLVTDLLNVSRIEEGRLLIQNNVLDPNQVIDTVVGEMRFKAQERAIELHSQKGEWPPVYADDDKVKEVMVNLIGNAVKYTNEGSVSVTVEVLPTTAIEAIDKKQQEFLKTPAGDEMLSHKIESERRKLVGDKQLVVHITDTGIGIPPEEINNIFRKFYRIGDITIQQTQGTGLGLYISRSLVEMMHGRMWVESPGRAKGSTFSFSLPLAAYEPQIKEAEQSIKVADTAKPLAHSSQFEL